MREWIIAVFAACATMASAQSVPVTGTADVSSIEARLTGIEARLSALENTTPPPVDPDPDPDPPTASGLIGMNSGFVWRDNFRHPDDPKAAGYSDLLAPICKVYRPMNWNRINDFNREVDSIDAAHQYTSKTWRDALSEQVAVCNSVGADFYFNTPARATPKFVKEAVAFIRGEIHDDALIYIAYANECWLPGRYPYDYLKATSGTDPGSGDNAFFDLWASKLDMVFEAARKGDPTCIRVVETKTARDGTWYTEQITSRMKSGFDAVAGTFYFAPPNSAYKAGVTAAQLLDAAEKEWRDDDRKWQEANIKWAKDRGLLALGYEAGQHYHQYGYEAQTRACQTDLRMAEQYELVYGNALEKGADLIIDFDFIDWDNEHGHWGKDDELSGLTSSIKYQVVKKIATQQN